MGHRVARTTTPPANSTGGFGADDRSHRHHNVCGKAAEAGVLSDRCDRIGLVNTVGVAVSVAGAGSVSLR